MENILLGLTICGSIIFISRCLFIYVDEFYELDFDIFVIEDK
jgi:hypothetical protein